MVSSLAVAPLSRSSERIDPRKSTEAATAHIVPTPPKIDTPANSGGCNHLQFHADRSVRAGARKPNRVHHAGQACHQAVDDEHRQHRAPDQDADESGGILALPDREDPSPGTCRVQNDTEHHTQHDQRTVTYGTHVPNRPLKFRLVKLVGKGVNRSSPSNAKQRPRKSARVPMVTASDCSRAWSPATR